MAKAEIRIDIDAKCSRCGTKGAAQNGLCLQCTGNDIVSKLAKEGTMADTRATVKTNKLEATVKMVEEKVEGAVVDRHLITSVTIEYEGTPARLDTVLHALRAGHEVDVTFGSAQLSLDMTDKAEELAGVA